MKSPGKYVIVDQTNSKVYGPFEQSSQACEWAKDYFDHDNWKYSYVESPTTNTKLREKPPWPYT